MKFALIILASTFALTVGKLNARDLSPKDAGEYHTEAFEKMAKKFKTRKPKNDLELISDVSDVLSDYCPHNDPSYSPQRIAMEAFHKGQSGQIFFYYPHDFDENLRDSIGKTISAVNTLNKLNIDETVEQLREIQKELEERDYDFEHYQTISMVGVSVAIESSKLWHSAFYDPEHDLHDMVKEGHTRRLQFRPSIVPGANVPSIPGVLTETETFPNVNITLGSNAATDLPFIILSDVAGGIKAGLEGSAQNASLLFRPTELTRTSLLASIAASASAALTVLGL